MSASSSEDTKHATQTTDWGGALDVAPCIGDILLDRDRGLPLHVISALPVAAAAAATQKVSF